MKNLLKQNEGTSLIRRLEKTPTIKAGMNRGKKRLFLGNENLGPESGTSLIQIVIVIIIIFTVMVMSGIFSPPRSPITDKREGDIVDDGTTSRKNTLNIRDFKIKLFNATPTPPTDTPPIPTTITPPPVVTSTPPSPTEIDATPTAASTPPAPTPTPAQSPAGAL